MIGIRLLSTVDGNEMVILTTATSPARIVKLSNGKITTALSVIRSGGNNCGNEVLLPNV